VLALLDATAHCVLLATRGNVNRVRVAKYPSLSRLANAGLHAHPDHLVRGFHFRTSASDVAALACLRALVAVVAWGAFSSRANLFRPYLLSSYACLALSVLLISVKAPQYAYEEARGPVWLAPLLFGLSLLAALGHVALASHSAAASRRRRSHLESCNSAEECWAVAAVPGPGARPAAHRRRQSREDVEASLRECGEMDTPASALADADSCFADLEGQSVHYRILPAAADDDCEEGARAGSAVLLLHGFGGGEHVWRQAAPLLARRCRCRVVAFDRAGFGLSGRPVRENFPEGGNPYTLHSAARVAVALCRQLGVVRVALVGHSDGCTLALLVAELLREQPDDAPDALRCVALALLAPSASGEVVPTSARLLLKSSVGLPLLRPLLRSEVGEASLRRAFHCASRITPAVLCRYAEPLRVVGWDRALWEVARCAGEVHADEVMALAESAGAAHTPAIVVAGAQDRVCAPEVAASFARALGAGVAVQCSLLPECGHLPQEEAPAALVAVLAPFLLAALWLAAPPCVAAPVQPPGLCCQV
jgi:pimeloyl-ACP methyl ester carboxylesterase